ncbi:hypothetical protein CD110_11100 [Staphylococcus casei]|uniref:hypothetical protein n=1 Tax=Staphylococcus TaxID=1279 RepID=UPI000CD2AC86|nr:hypothetical protein [Staphylococcus casei]PNZ57760.1 hypothetical protein CD110_11100 [Staphylococcus casei]WJE85823.1 hypothetical protein QMO72_10435 [Staphylococcus casei]
MKKHDPLHDYEQIDLKHEKSNKGLRQMMVENDNYEARKYSKTRFLLFVFVIFLILIAFGIVGIFIL